MSRRLTVALIAALLVAGCAGQPAPPAASPTAASASSSASAPSAATATRSVQPTPSGPPAAWSQVPPAPALNDVAFLDVIWTGTRFVAVGAGPDGNAVVADSSDGIAWHLEHSPGPIGETMQLAAGPRGLVAVGSLEDHLVTWVSTDGVAWSVHRDGFKTAAGARSQGAVADVAARGDGWLAAGSHDPACEAVCAPDRALVWTSDDGVDWTEVSDQNALDGGFIDALTTTSHGFEAAGTSTGKGAGAAIWTSPDGLAWTRVPDDPIFASPAGPDHGTGATAIAARDGHLVVLGYTSLADESSAAIAWWSASGSSWSKADADGAADVAVGATGTPDGFLALWAGDCLGGVWASTDGHAWHCDATEPGFVGFSPAAVTASDAVEVVVGSTAPAEGESQVPPSSSIWTRALR